MTEGRVLTDGELVGALAAQRGKVARLSADLRREADVERGLVAEYERRVAEREAEDA